MRDRPEVATMIGELNKRIAELEEENAELRKELLEAYQVSIREIKSHRFSQIRPFIETRIAELEGK